MVEAAGLFPWRLTLMLPIPAAGFMFKI